MPYASCPSSSDFYCERREKWYYTNDNMEDELSD